MRFINCTLLLVICLLAAGCDRSVNDSQPATTMEIITTEDGRTVSRVLSESGEVLYEFEPFSDVRVDADDNSKPQRPPPVFFDVEDSTAETLSVLDY